MFLGIAWFIWGAFTFFRWGTMITEWYEWIAVSGFAIGLLIAVLLFAHGIGSAILNRP